MSRYNTKQTPYPPCVSCCDSSLAEQKQSSCILVSSNSLVNAFKHTNFVNYKYKKHDASSTDPSYSKWIRCDSLLHTHAVVSFPKLESDARCYSFSMRVIDCCERFTHKTIDQCEKGGCKISDWSECNWVEA